MYRADRVIRRFTLGAALFGLLTAGCGTVHEMTVKDRHPPEGEIDEKGRHVVDEGNSPAVVMFHGCPGSTHDFGHAYGSQDSVRAQLKRDYRAITFDLPGHGQTQSGSWPKGADEQVEWVHELLTDYKVDDPILVGYSSGGALALLYAQEYHDEIKGLVLISPIVYADEDLVNKELDIVRVPILGDLIGAIVGGPLASGEIRKQLVRAFAPQAVPEEYLRICADMWSRPSELKAIGAHSEALFTILQTKANKHTTIRVPIVILTGEEDTVVAPQKHAGKLVETLGGSRILWHHLADTGHAVQFDHPHKVVQAVNRIEKP